MDFYEAVEKRRTIRHFDPAPIEEETVERIIAAGMKAPTNDHMRDWHFIVIRDKAVVNELLLRIPMEFSKKDIDGVLRDWHLDDPCQQDAYRAAIPRQYPMLAEGACLLIPLFGRKNDFLHPQDISSMNGLVSIWCCIENIFLAATAEGYACSLRIPLGDEAAWAQKVLGFPEPYTMPCFIAVGKPAAGVAPIVQKPYVLSERIHKDRW